VALALKARVLSALLRVGLTAKALEGQVVDVIGDGCSERHGAAPSKHRLLTG
jgi:hypothetical protein